MTNPIYRLVCTAKSTEKIVTHIMGIDEYKFTYEDAVNLQEEINGLDERIKVQVEIECPQHGWSKTLIGECYECQREAAENARNEVDSCAYCIDPHGCPCVVIQRKQREANRREERAPQAQRRSSRHGAEVERQPEVDASGFSLLSLASLRALYERLATALTHADPLAVSHSAIPPLARLVSHFQRSVSNVSTQSRRSRRSPDRRP